MLFLKNVPGTLLLYESPHRLKETLVLIREILGNRKITLCRELTKIYEEFIRGTLEEAIAWSQSEEIRGEFCLVIEQGELQTEENNWWEDLSIVQHVDHYVEKEGITVKEAIKKTALDRECKKRHISRISYSIRKRAAALNRNIKNMMVFPFKAAVL